MTFAAGCSLLLWVIVSIFANGIALLHHFTKLRGIALVGYGAAAGAFFHAVLGLAIAAMPTTRWLTLLLLLGLTAASIIYFFIRKVLRELLAALGRQEKISLVLWFLFLLLNLGLLHLEIQFPENLPDGRYVLKDRTANVKIQYLTALPADNFIPFAVAEFFLRGISFKKTRPIMPAEEVSNHTILMSLVAMPFRALLGAPRDRPQLGTFTYVGREWPDVAKLNTDHAFEQFAVIGIVLNSLLLLGLLVFCSTLGANSVLAFATLLYITNPYFISHTIFTWPKSLCGFFILLSWVSLRNGHGPLVVAFLLALAYHCHPYALVFAGFAGLFYFAQWWRKNSRLSAALTYLLVFALSLAPWIVWTRFILHIPSNIVAQNFAGLATVEAWASPINFFWVRFYHLFQLVAPVMFSVYPFNLEAVVNNFLFCLPGAVGLVLIYPALAQCAQLPRPQPWIWYGLFGPACLLLLVFSEQHAAPVLHGYQPLAGVLLFFGVWWLWRQTSRALCLALIGLQLALNLSVVFARGLIVGARF